MYRFVAKRVASPLTFSLVALAFAVACNSNEDHPADAQPGVDSGVSPEVDAAPPVADAADTPDALPPVCPSPFTVPIDPTAEANARNALKSLSETATLDWAPVRGTISSVSGLTFPLANCTGSTDVYQLLFEMLKNNPILWQIDPTEWKADGVVTCDSITGFQTLHIRRKKYGPYPTRIDAFHAVTDLVNGVVILRNFSGTYIPPAPPALIAMMQACADRPDSAAEAELRAVPFGYDEYGMSPTPACTIIGHATYTATPADTMTLSPEVTAVWEELDTIQIHRERDAILTVVSANYTPALLNSSADCVDDNFNPQVGWFRTFDAINSKVVFENGSPDPYCIVCFGGQK
jgi:hypothetical protein